MAAIYQTAYPRIKSNLSQDELGDIYTLTTEDQKFALRHCKRASISFLGLLIQLKTTQRLGRFSSLKEIPKAIITHIKNQCLSRATLKELQAYFASGAKGRHVKLIRRYIRIKPFDKVKTSKLVKIWALEAAMTKEMLPDIINVTLEYLVKERYELPGFSTLERLCQAARTEVNTQTLFFFPEACLSRKSESIYRSVVAPTMLINLA